MDERSAWEAFTHTGSVSSYLAYCKAKQEAVGAVAPAGEDTDADNDRRSGDRREDRGGE
ncbi:MAG: hypothetical protein PUC32_06400 [Oscillospiraceae bacterium]|nr:hypothetical protein [Oscillospiraceae bacterium]